MSDVESDAVVAGPGEPRRLRHVRGPGGLLRLFFDVCLPQTLHGGDLRRGGRMGLRPGLQDRAGDRPGRGLRPVQADRGQGDRRDEGRTPGRRHHRVDRHFMAGPGAVRRDACAVERGRPVPERPTAGPDLGPGVRFHGGPAHQRGSGRHIVRQLHPVLGRGEVGRKGPDGASACQRLLDAGSRRRRLHAPAGRLCPGPRRPASAQSRRRSRPRRTPTDAGARADRLPDRALARS